MSTLEWPWLAACEAEPELAGFRPVLGTEGMVSSPHAVASRIGLDILRRGGNAVDAAIATSAALMVSVPMQCGPGGDAFWMIASAQGEVCSLDASGRAGRNADASALLERGLTAIPPRSAFAVTVPGAVDGWAKAWSRFGTIPFADLLEPAAELAERGYSASRHTVASFMIGECGLRQHGALDLFGTGCRIPQLYEVIRQPNLAATLRKLGDTNGRALYEGPIAAAICEVVRETGGWLVEADLADHASEWTKPLAATYRDLTVYTAPPPSQGFALLAALRRLEAASYKPLHRKDPGAVHLMVEAVAAGLALRDEHNGDRTDLSDQLDCLWGTEHAQLFAESFDPDRRSATAAAPTARLTKGDTAHLAVVDHNGMSVSLIQSLFFDFGTYLPVTKGGFVLQNRGAAFHFDRGMPGHLAPGARPPSTLMPTIALRDGIPAITFGCMGGDGQMQTQAQLLVDVTDGKLDAQQAVSRPRWYLDRASGGEAVVCLETGIDEAVVEGLRARGHIVRVLGQSEELMGHAQVIQRVGTTLVGAADPRSDGQAAGY